MDPRVRESKSRALPLGDSPLLRMGGLEPPIHRLKAGCHTAWLHAHKHRAGIEPAKKGFAILFHAIWITVHSCGCRNRTRSNRFRAGFVTVTTIRKSTCDCIWKIRNLLSDFIRLRTQNAKSRQPFRLTAFQSGDIIFRKLLKQR